MGCPPPWNVTYWVSMLSDVKLLVSVSALSAKIELDVTGQPWKRYFQRWDGRLGECSLLMQYFLLKTEIPISSEESWESEGKFPAVICKKFWGYLKVERSTFSQNTSRSFSRVNHIFASIFKYWKKKKLFLLYVYFHDAWSVKIEMTH